MIYIYTDASTEGSVGVAVSIVKRRDTLIKVLKGEYPIIGPSAAEIYGILQSVKYVANCNYTEPITLYTDLETAVRTFEKLNVEKPVFKDVAYPQVWRQIMKECKKLNIDFQHMDSHSSKFNENTACDRLSFYIRKFLPQLKKEGLM